MVSDADRYRLSITYSPRNLQLWFVTVALKERGTLGMMIKCDPGQQYIDDTERRGGSKGV